MGDSLIITGTQYLIRSLCYHGMGMDTVIGTQLNNREISIDLHLTSWSYQILKFMEGSGFASLIPVMMQVGLDGLQALQPYCRGMEPARLKTDFGDKIVLMGCIDTQLLIEGQPDLVRDETRKILEIMKPGGGYIASASHDYLLPETPVENVIAMFDTIGECGGYA